MLSCKIHTNDQQTLRHDSIGVWQILLHSNKQGIFYIDFLAINRFVDTGGRAKNESLLFLNFWWHAFKMHGGHLWKVKLVCNDAGY